MESMIKSYVFNGLGNEDLDQFWFVEKAAWEAQGVTDSNWIHKELPKNHYCINSGQTSKNSKTEFKNTLNQWQWQPTWNDKGLGQSPLTEAHGDCARG